MATRIEDLFLLARDTLNDHQKQRWSDETLFRNLRLAIQDIAKQTGLFKMIIQVPLDNGRGVYILPDGILRLSHVTFEQELLPLVSSGWMAANQEIDWRTKGVTIPPGKLEKAIFDEIKRKELAVYPRPFGDFRIYYVSVPNEFGLVGGIDDYSTLSPYGLIGELIDTEIDIELQDSYYGVVTAIEEAASLTIYYTRCPPLPYLVDDELELDECFDSALKSYICGIALRNDVDAANRNMAMEEFKIYERDIEAIEQLANADSVDALWFESHYNPMG